MCLEDNMFKKIERRLSRLYYAKAHRLLSKTAIVSFTFDDVPKSSIDEGARILQKYNAAGTFYLSASLAGKNIQDVPQNNFDDIHRLLEGGHEIGCHTFGHVAVQDLNPPEIVHELDRNLAALTPYIGDHSLTSFSYPFGSVSIAAKKLVARRFSTGRGIHGGLNKGIVDLSQLKANAIYSDYITEGDINNLIQSSVNNKSWLIFYTHDISETPTQYGCTAELFEYAVKCAIDSDCEIFCVRAALARSSFI